MMIIRFTQKRLITQIYLFYQHRPEYVQITFLLSCALILPRFSFLCFYTWTFHNRYPFPFIQPSIQLYRGKEEEEEEVDVDTYLREKKEEWKGMDEKMKRIYSVMHRYRCLMYVWLCEPERISVRQIFSFREMKYAISHKSILLQFS